MAVMLSLSEKQAAVLKPLLDKINETLEPTSSEKELCTLTNNARNNELEEGVSDARGEPSLPEGMRVSPALPKASQSSTFRLCSSFSTFELLQKKKKNTKSTQAQNCLHVRPLII